MALKGGRGLNFDETHSMLNCDDPISKFCDWAEAEFLLWESDGGTTRGC